MQDVLMEVMMQDRHDRQHTTHDIENMTYNYDRLTRGDEIVLTADWDDDDGGKKRETEFVTIDDASREVVVRWRGDRYRFDVDSPYYIYISDECWECGQETWRIVAESVEVDFPAIVDNEQLTLTDI